MQFCYNKTSKCSLKIGAELKFQTRLENLPIGYLCHFSESMMNKIMKNTITTTETDHDEKYYRSLLNNCNAK